MKTAASICSGTSWRFPPAALALGRDEVHVWRASLDQTPSRAQSFFCNLAPDERTRAERFHFQRDREHFIVARGVLRAILGGYLNRAPESLTFSYGSHGKPALAGESDGDAIRFSVSHSRGVALYAVTRGREVGIDLEGIRLDLAVEEIAERFFSRRQTAILRAIPRELRRQAFFRCWTIKEAYIKALGEGLSLPLVHCDVALDSGDSAAAISSEPDPSGAARWFVKELTPAPGYFAALAVEGSGWRLACWQWQHPTPRLL